MDWTQSILEGSVILLDVQQKEAKHSATISALQKLAVVLPDVYSVNGLVCYLFLVACDPQFTPHAYVFLPRSIPAA